MSVHRLDDYRRFDAGTPTRCYRCGCREAMQVFGDAGYVWACRGCPHPEDAVGLARTEEQ